jgi:cell division septation protein DedD
MAAVEVPQPAPQPIGTAIAAPQPEPEAVYIPAAAPAPTAVTVQLAPAKPVVRAPRAAPAVRPASLTTPRPAFRRASLPLAKSINTVVQLAAYDSRAYVADGWNRMARRYGALRAYSPVVAQFNSPKGLVYRLSVRGFASPSEAKGLCQSLKRSGGACFVRSVAGDAPVRIASR